MCAQDKGPHIDIRLDRMLKYSLFSARQLKDLVCSYRGISGKFIEDLLAAALISSVDLELSQKFARGSSRVSAFETGHIVGTALKSTLVPLPSGQWARKMLIFRM